MRRYLIGAAVIAATLTPAQAGPLLGGHTDGMESISLSCTPPLDRQDPNPVKRIDVGANNGGEREGPTMIVEHVRWNNDIINRGDQYINSNVKRLQGNIFVWSGQWVKNPNHTMMGAIFSTPDGRWWYREKRWSNGIPEWDITSQCTRIAN
jgi:hypothetical protein